MEAPPPSHAQMEVPPPSYDQVSNTRCRFVDFVPYCLEEKGFFETPKYESFSVIFERANTWLRNNPEWKVTSCESSESKLKSSGTAQANTSKSTYTVDAQRNTFYIRYFRLWVCNKTPGDSPEPQQLAYYNVVPKCVGGAVLLGKPKFENFSETIWRLNEKLSERPLQGRIINMETQNLKFRSWNNTVCSDTCWQECAEEKVYFLMMLTVFLEVGDGYVNHIGAEDFVPERSDSFDTFRGTMIKANEWIDRKPDNFTICNVQSINYKLEFGCEKLDTNKPLYCEHGDSKTRFLRIIRVYYSQYSAVSCAVRERPLQVTYKTFMPRKISSDGSGLGEYETQWETCERMLRWINATGAKVMSCETIKVRGLDEYQRGNPEVMYALDRGERSRYFIYGLRLYLDGHFPDPPIPDSPRRPRPTRHQDEEDDCCVIL